MTLTLPPATAFEWRRIKSIRSTTWLLGLIVVPAVVGGAQNLGADTPAGLAAGAVRHVGEAGFLAAAVGAIAIGTEYRWNTIRHLFITFPRRYDILNAKLGVVAGLVAAASLLASLIGGALGAFSGVSTDSMLDWLDLSLRAVLVIVGWAVIGFALAGLAKSTIVGIAVPLVFAVIGETVLVQITASEAVALVLPFYNANQAVSTTLSTAEAYEHLAVFTAWVLLCWGVSNLVLGRRDA